MWYKRVLLDRVRVASEMNSGKGKGFVAEQDVDGFSKKLTDFSIDRILSDDQFGSSFRITDRQKYFYKFEFVNQFKNETFQSNEDYYYYYSNENSEKNAISDQSFYLDYNYNHSMNNSNMFGCNKLNNLDGQKMINSSSNNEITRNIQHDSPTCSICHKVFESASVLIAHSRTHKPSKYECQICRKGFSQLRNYKYHISVHNGTKEFAATCPECGKMFNDKGYLGSHMKIHRNRKEYACPHCPKSFNQRVAFNMHVRIHTGVKPHKCAECGKRFSRKMLLKQHLRTHSGEKPYECSVCGKMFADRSNMTLHHRLHSGVKPFSCPICPKAFTKKHHLKTHLNYHMGCKPYKCPYSLCGQSFTQSSNMRTHSKKCQYRQNGQ